MVYLDVIIGFFTPGLISWLFLLFVIIFEGCLLSKFLTKKWINYRIMLSSMTANIMTSIIGFIMGYSYLFRLFTNEGGGHILNWVPVYFYGPNQFRLFNQTILIFGISFLISVFIESIINLLFLTKLSSAKKIIIMTVCVNSLSYLIAGIIILINAYVVNLRLQMRFYIEQARSFIDQVT